MSFDEEDDGPNMVPVPVRDAWWHEKTGIFTNPQEVDFENNEDLQALAALAYDGTPFEVAENFKNQGNKELAKGKIGYSEAIRLYTEGIEAKCDDAKLNGALYSNRAHVQMIRENYGYALSDAKEAIKHDPTNVKSFYRAAKCCSKLRKWQECIQFAEQGLALEPANELLKAELKVSTGILESILAKERAEQEKKGILAAELRKRGIKMAPLSAETGGDLAQKGPRFEDGEMIWTVLLAVDECNMVETADAVSENATMRDVLEHMYEQPPQWSSKYRYSKDMELYYAGASGKWIRVNLDSVLGNVLMHRECVVRQVPTFHLVLNNTPYKKEFLAQPPPELR